MVASFWRLRHIGASAVVRVPMVRRSMLGSVMMDMVVGWGRGMGVGMGMSMRPGVRGGLMDIVVNAPMVVVDRLDRHAVAAEELQVELRQRMQCRSILEVSNGASADMGVGPRGALGSGHTVGDVVGGADHTRVPVVGVTTGLGVAVGVGATVDVSKDGTVEGTDKERPVPEGGGVASMTTMSPLVGMSRCGNVLRHAPRGCDM